MKLSGAARPSAGAGPPPQLREFLRACRPDWKEGELKVVVRKLAQIGVFQYRDLVERLRAGDLNQRLERFGLRRFSLETLERLRIGACLEPAERAEDERAEASVEADRPPQPPKPDEEEEAAEVECAICYEPVRQVAELPCACKVDYCMQCWDRALSQSFQKCSMARCPTCRSPVRVDFNNGEDRLIFSRETEVLEEDSDGDDVSAAADYFERTLTRITDQVRPAQIRLLKDYGAAHSALVRDSGTPSSSPLHGRGYAESWSSNVTKHLPGALDCENICATVERCVTEGMSGPKCVCGGLLKRVTAEKRSGLMLQERGLADLAEEGSEVGRLFAEILQRHNLTSIICDLCEEEVPSTSSVWMCENGDRTIKHATEYDICDACFASCVS